VSPSPNGSATSTPPGCGAPPGGCASPNLQVTLVSRGIVELHGWVRSRAERAQAARVACDVPGVDTVINSILVRGEDDRTHTPDYLATDQSA
jgi:hypothetical protein